MTLFDLNEICLQQGGFDNRFSYGLHENKLGISIPLKGVIEDDHTQYVTILEDEKTSRWNFYVTGDRCERILHKEFSTEEEACRYFIFTCLDTGLVRFKRKRKDSLWDYCYLVKLCRLRFGKYRCLRNYIITSASMQGVQVRDKALSVFVDLKAECRDNGEIRWTIYYCGDVVKVFDDRTEACKAFYYYIADLQKIERTPGEIRRIKFRRFFRIRFRRLKNLFRSGNV